MTGVPSPGRALAPQDLKQLVEAIAGDESRWRHLVKPQRERRHYDEILSTEQVGVWLICWMDEHDTGFHDHDRSAAAIAVVEGLVREERLAVGAPPSRVYGRGETFEVAPQHIHRMSHAGGGPAVSIHAYSPPLLSMGSYAIGPDGVITRTSKSYAEELRPLEAVAA